MKLTSKNQDFTINGDEEHNFYAIESTPRGACGFLMGMGRAQIIELHRLLGAAVKEITSKCSECGTQRGYVRGWGK